MAIILDGRKVADKLLIDLKAKIKELSHISVDPKLAVILVGENEVSESYIKQKQNSALEVGIQFDLHRLPDTITTEELILFIEKLNTDIEVHGIIVQLPLPDHIDSSLVTKAVSPRKDVDGFQAYNVGKMFLNKEYESLPPCTPKGVIRLLEAYEIPIAGKEITVVGHSNIVGKPMAIMFLNREATVTVCHKATADLKKHTLNADILVIAVGKPNLITADMVKKGAVVVDVGCTKVDGKLHGDVDFQAVSEVASHISPVPGGVGPMTVATLIENTITAYEWLHGHNFAL